MLTNYSELRKLSLWQFAKTRFALKTCVIVELTMASIMSLSVALGVNALIAGAMLCWTLAATLYVLMPEDSDD